MQKKKHDLVLKVVGAVLIGLTFLSFVKAIWISLDIDESYAVACAYRMVRGDRLIRDMWEPHQLSAFLPALFAAPYIRIRGNTDYLVIWLRIIGVLIHTGMGVLLYRQLGKKIDRFAAFCIMILHLNFLPKWVQMPEFELMHYWCLLGIFLSLYAYFTGKKPGMLLPFLGGCLLAVSMLCYPTMFLLYPFYILAIFMLERQGDNLRGMKQWRSSALFTLGAVLTGTVFLACLFSYMSLDELKRYISYIFLDTSHGVYTMGEKWSIYGKQIQEQAGDYGWYLLAAAGIVLFLCLIYRFALHRNIFCKRSLGRQGLAVCIWPVVTVVLVLAGLLMQLKAISGFLFEDENQFFLQLRYMAVILPALLIGIRHCRKMAVWLYLCIIPGLVSVAAVLFVTNMDINTAYSKAFLGVLGGLVIICQYSGAILEGSFGKKVFTVLSYALGGMLLTGLLVCRLILIRVSGCLPVTLRASLERMENGPEKGVYVLADTAEVWNNNYRELENEIDREDRVLYIGAESLVYVEMEALPATPSTQGTTVYNEMFLRYYEEHPERIPNVIVYDKTFGENPVYSLYYGYSLQNPEFFHWIEENYRDARKTETDHMIILKRE